MQNCLNTFIMRVNIHFILFRSHINVNICKIIKLLGWFLGNIKNENLFLIQFIYCSFSLLFVIIIDDDDRCSSFKAKSKLNIY